LPHLALRIARLPVPFVVDHMGHFPVAQIAPEAAAFQTLLALVRDGGWVKLSGAYRLSEAPRPYAETTPYVQQLIEAAPQRCVWGSDWPNVGDLLDTLFLWAPDAEVRHNILVRNPAELYGF
jgi:2-pyrone-4,6-dicarboxylate lactonase